jgi:serine/threonine-protein kinase
MAGQPRYRITEKLDAGGMAEVYRGTAESAVGGLKKAVAIKKILPHLAANKSFISMFLDEAKVSMYLQHANIVGVFDIGMADTSYFIVMEYVDGANLKAILDSLKRQKRRLTIPQTLYLMMEVCKGLQYAHDAVEPETGKPLHIVHRDISPPNILVSKRGEVKLVDFGLAKANSQLTTTDPGVVKGKFSYLSPEAASGESVDRRADIFAVGILLYELLTGKRLFYGESDYETVELVRAARIPPIVPQNPEVEPELEQVIRRALARDVESRFQTAGDLQDALAQYLFSQRLKVTSRDIEQLLASVLEEKRRHKGGTERANVGALIDDLINEEILKFTSLDPLGADNSPSQWAGGSSASPSPVSPGGAPLNPDSFIDTRGWVSDLGARQSGIRMAVPVTQIDSLEEMLEGTGKQPTPSAYLTSPGERPASSEAGTRAAGGAAPAPPPGGSTRILLVVLAVVAVGAGVALYFLQ